MYRHNKETLEIFCKVLTLLVDYIIAHPCHSIEQYIQLLNLYILELSSSPSIYGMHIQLSAIR